MIPVKVPYQILQFANNKGVWSDVEFYYMLKSLTPQGSFIKGSVVTSIQSSFDISSASVWRRLKRLHNLGWIRNNKLSYHLVSYDYVWKSLGYNVIRNKKGHLRFPLHKFLLQDFKLQVAQHDLNTNLKKQTCRVRKNLQHAGLCLNDYSAIKNCETKQLREKLEVLCDKRPVDIIRAQDRSKVAEQLENAFFKEIPHCNPDITLSSKGFANLIGLKSASSGHRMLRAMEKKKLISIRVRVACLGMKHPLQQMPQGPQYWLESGNMIMKQLPSKLYVNLES